MSWIIIILVALILCFMSSILIAVIIYKCKCKNNNDESLNIIKEEYGTFSVPEVTENVIECTLSDDNIDIPVIICGKCLNNKYIQCKKCSGTKGYYIQLIKGIHYTSGTITKNEWTICDECNGTGNIQCNLCLIN